MENIEISQQESIEDLVLRLTSNFNKILSIDEIKKYHELYWGGNGVGDRWAKKRFNYAVIYSNRSSKKYSENEYDEIPEDLLREYKENQKGSGIIGIYVFSKKTGNSSRCINKKIHKKIVSESCVVCGTNSDIICDHKNDLYNDPRVLNVNTQVEADFQPLCNHCNLQKRQVCKDEHEKQKIFSAKNIRRYQQYRFEFPWEKKIFDKTDMKCKEETYWFDPVEFENKIYCYLSYVIPVINAIKSKVVRID